jgi:hypothetical protein
MSRTGRIKVRYHTSIVIIGTIVALIFSSFSLSIVPEAKTPFIPQIALQPISQEVSIGETFQVDIYVDAMDNRLRGVTLDLIYPSRILQVKNITLGSLFGSFAIINPQSGDDGAGHIHYTVLTSQRLSSSKGIFLSITFLLSKGTPDSLHFFKLSGSLYSWNYKKIPETQITSGYFTIREPDYDEYFKSVSLSGFDSNGDGYNDGIQVIMDVITTGGAIDVSVKGTLLDPRGNKDDEARVSWQISGATINAKSLSLYGDGPEGWFTVTLHLFDNRNHFEDSWTGTLYLFPLALPITYVNATPSIQAVQFGASFSIAITIDPGRPLAGIQLVITFDPSFLSITDIQKGDLFEGITHYFNKGIIDNKNGTITQIYATTIESIVTDPGTFIIVNMTAKNLSGMSTFSIINALIAAPDGIESPLVIQNASIYVETLYFYDFNGDTRINILDLVFVVSHWGEIGTPGWIIADVNTDGVINVLDVLLLSEHWTG